MAAIDPRRLRAWRAAEYALPGAAARIGRRSATVDAVLTDLNVRVGMFVAAGNPHGRRAPDAANARAMRRLLLAARRWPHQAGWGGGRGWREPHVLIGGDPRRALVLARRFRQAGVVVVARGRAAQLIML